jgi:MYXO-CTERM domain-containing protein
VHDRDPSSEASGCDLADRLMRALEAGAHGGAGDTRCTPGGIPADSAFLQVDGEDGTVVQLEAVNTAPADPIAMLRAQYDVWRAANPCPVDAGAGEAVAGCCSGGNSGGSGVLGAMVVLALGRRRRPTP